MRWIFTNEDKVWRARGGRPGEETLSQFLALLSPKSGLPCVPGVVCFFERPERDAQGNVRDARVCGYLLGEWVDADTYEVITTWTSPHCRGMRVALLMYERLLGRLAQHPRPPRFIFCDMIQGAVAAIVRASPPLALLARTRTLPYVVRVAPSYETPLGDGKVERFERVTLRTAPLHFAFRLTHACQRAAGLRSFVLPVGLIAVWIGANMLK